jgi:hypothetical protein
VTVLVDARAGDAVSVRWITPTRLRVDVGGVSRDVVIGRGLLRTSG